MRDIDLIVHDVPDFLKEIFERKLSRRVRPTDDYKTILLLARSLIRTILEDPFPSDSDSDTEIPSPSVIDEHPYIVNLLNGICSADVDTTEEILQAFKIVYESGKELSEYPQTMLLDAALVPDDILTDEEWYRLCNYLGFRGRGNLVPQEPMGTPSVVSRRGPSETTDVVSGRGPSGTKFPKEFPQRGKSHAKILLGVLRFLSKDLSRDDDNTLPEKVSETFGTVRWKEYSAKSYVQLMFYVYHLHKK